MELLHLHYGLDPLVLNTFPEAAPDGVSNEECCKEVLGLMIGMLEFEMQRIGTSDATYPNDEPCMFSAQMESVCTLKNVRDDNKPKVIGYGFLPKDGSQCVDRV